MPMTQLPQFGFELEFQTGAEDVVRGLVERYPNLCQTPTLHGYHCRCNFCQYTGVDEDGEDCETIPLRGQNDSSCSGEVISHIFPVGDTGRDEARECYRALQEIAVDLDAIPGLTAGLHVHVNRRGIRAEDLRLQTFAWMAWESVFSWIARGRFSIIREFNRPHQRLFYECILEDYQELHEIDDFSYTMNNLVLEGQENLSNTERIMAKSRHTVAVWLEWMNSLDNDAQEYWFIKLYQWMSGLDRHSYMVPRTQHETTEFRLWNSTRAAWRMELYSELSRLWLHPPFINHLLDLIESGFTPNDDIITSAGLVLDIVNEVKSDVAPLLERQIEWMKKLDAGEVEVNNAQFAV